MTYAHLTGDTALLAEQPDAVRIAALAEECWVGYTRAEQALAKFRWLLDHPRRHRMPNLLLCGLTNNGKSALITRFLMEHPPCRRETGDTEEIRVLCVEAPSGPHARRFYLTLLRQLNPSYPASRSLAVQEADTIHLLRTVGLRMLIIDEIHNILTGTRDQVRQFLNLLRFLGNMLEIPIVGVGVKEALATMQADDQTANRFEPFVLPRWRPGEEYLTLLDSLEAILPLRAPSDLSDPALADRIMAMSEGILGEIVTVLTRSTEAAIQSGKERIDAAILRSIAFIPPSQRRHHAHAQLDV